MRWNKKWLICAHQSLSESAANQKIKNKCSCGEYGRNDKEGLGLSWWKSKGTREGGGKKPERAAAYHPLKDEWTREKKRVKKIHYCANHTTLVVY